MNVEPFCDVDDVQDRLEWEMDEDMRRIAGAAIVDLSIDALHIGDQSWLPETAPALVGSLVARAAARHVRNPEAYSQSRSGDETLGWQERPGEELATASFNENEINRLRALSKHPHSVNVMQASMAWAPQVKDEPRWDYYVPVGDRGMKFPMLAPESNRRFGYVVEPIVVRL